ncbi:MAG: peptide ABC transporter substrate-binding protein [Oscillospiraceae bacterium]|nr:peptide ABC transporter substrate-binding protein [Oscillospiraceae bacterium]
MKKLLALLLALIMLLSLAACGGSAGEESESEAPGSEAESGGEETADRFLNVHVAAAIQSIDPLGTGAGDDFEVIGHLIDGLILLNGDGSLAPGLAETWEVSEDQLTWTFHLRDANWYNVNGVYAPVTASDFVFAWQRMVDPNNAAEYAFIFGDAAGIVNASEIVAGEKAPSELGVEAVDEKTLAVHLVAPCGFFETLMYFPAFFPANQAFVEECGDLYATAPEYFLSCGPYVMTDYSVAATAFTLTKSAEYWDAAAVICAGINYKVILDYQEAYLAYQNGELDVAKLSSEMVELVAADPEYRPVMTGYLWYVTPNISGGKGLENANIRKALALSYDRQHIADYIMKDGSIPAYWYVPYGLSTGPDGLDYRKSVNNTEGGNADTEYQYNPMDIAAAQEAFAAGLAELGVSSLSYTIVVEDLETALYVAQFLKEQWETNLAGLEITIASMPKKERSDLMKGHTFDLGIARWGPDYADPMTYMTLWLSTSASYNYGLWNNPEYDTLINGVTNGEFDAEGRWATFKQAEKLVASDYVIYPLYQTCDATLIKTNVTGVEFHTVGLNRVFIRAVIA